MLGTIRYLIASTCVQLSHCQAIFWAMSMSSLVNHVGGLDRNMLEASKNMLSVNVLSMLNTSKNDVQNICFFVLKLQIVG